VVAGENLTGKWQTKGQKTQTTAKKGTQKECIWEHKGGNGDLEKFCWWGGVFGRLVGGFGFCGWGKRWWCCLGCKKGDRIDKVRRKKVVGVKKRIGMGPETWQCESQGSLKPKRTGTLKK